MNVEQHNTREPARFLIATICPVVANSLLDGTVADHAKHVQYSRRVNNRLHCNWKRLNGKFSWQGARTVTRPFASDSPAREERAHAHASLRPTFQGRKRLAPSCSSRYEGNLPHFARIHTAIPKHLHFHPRLPPTPHTSDLPALNMAQYSCKV